MAKQTSIHLRDLQFYQIFIRQFTPTHDFKGATKRLEKVKELGTSVIQLVPFHPIGEFHRKGSIGSPYSIADYYSIDSLHGSLDDFKAFLTKAHELGMKVIMDIVFNHTSHDANYTKTHPEWYYQDELGNFKNRVGDWWDIADFIMEGNTALQDELINVLTYWVNQGIDGFRCDVAPLIPMEFWQRARDTLSKIRPDLIWLSESVHRGFVKYLRDLGYEAASDSEVYQVFDVCYDYDIHDHFENYLLGKGTLKEWLDNLVDQDMIYPKNYVKIRYLENHDLKRAASYTKTPAQLRNLNALLFFLRGAVFIFNGQELGIDHRPDLFEIDEIDWNHQDGAKITPLIKTLSEFKKKYHYINDPVEVNLLSDDVVSIEYKDRGSTRVIQGIFNLGSKPQEVVLEKGGIDYLSKETITPSKHLIKEPLIFILN